MGRFLARRLLATLPVLADRRRARVRDAAADAGRSGGGARRRRGDHRADRPHPLRPRPRPVDSGAVRDLGRSHALGRPRRVVLLQDQGHRPDRPAPRADALARGAHDHDRGPRRGAARRARGVALRRLARSRPDGVLGARLLDPDLRPRLPADLVGVAAARLAAGAGLPAPRRTASGRGFATCCCPRSRSR